MSKAVLKISLRTDEDLVFGLFDCIGTKLQYTIIPGFSMVDGQVEKQASIEFHKISKEEMFLAWLRIFKYLRSLEGPNPIKNCGHLSNAADGFSGCIWEFFTDSMCPYERFQRRSKNLQRPHYGIDA